MEAVVKIEGLVVLRHHDVKYSVLGTRKYLFSLHRYYRVVRQYKTSSGIQLKLHLSISKHIDLSKSAYFF